MTNQEIISLLDQIRHILLNSKSWLPRTHDPINEAFDVAISAIQAQDVPDINIGDMISRRKAIDAHCELCEDRGRCNCDICPDVEVFRLLPSAQPEIIRCKDCKWWSNDDYRECSSPNYDDGYVTPAGFYCGYAERRTDE